MRIEFFLFSVLFSMLASISSAATHTFLATSSEGAIEFWISFDDFDDDDLLSFDEIEEFSGFAIQSNFFDRLFNLPQLVGFVDGPLVDPSLTNTDFPILGSAEFGWIMGNIGNEVPQAFIGRNFSNYSITEMPPPSDPVVVSPVPISPTWAFMMLGLGSLASTRIKKRYIDLVKSDHRNLEKPTPRSNNTPGG